MIEVIDDKDVRKNEIIMALQSIFLRCGTANIHLYAENNRLRVKDNVDGKTYKIELEEAK